MDHIEIIHEVVFELPGFELGEAGLAHHLFREFDPHMAPRPMPPCARETVMQWRQEMV